jgi:uncharacterized protein YndB with AHSA1/START domain
MTGFDIRLQRIVNVTPDAAFKHWVDAEARHRWYAPDDSWIIAEAETDLRVGGAWRVQFGPTPDEIYVEHGVFEEVDPPHRVVYTPTTSSPTGAPRSKHTSPSHSSHTATRHCSPCSTPATPARNSAPPTRPAGRTSSMPTNARSRPDRAPGTVDPTMAMKLRRSEVTRSIAVSARAWPRSSPEDVPSRAVRSPGAAGSAT